MISVFQGCSNLISIDVSKFDTSIVISMANMFHSCYKLSSIDPFSSPSGVDVMILLSFIMEFTP